MKEYDLSKRLLRFSVDVILFLRKLPNTEEYKIIKRNQRSKLLAKSDSWN